MYQKNNCDGLANIATSQSWQNEGILTDILSFEPSNLAFTPTTLATMERTLESFESEVVSESGDYNTDDYDDDDDLSNMSWEQAAPAAKRAKSSSAGSAVSSSTSTRRLPGPKSSIRTEDMTPEEQRRRQRRRERNKQAAARCRQRRVDITNQLLTETQQLEAEAQKLEREIDNLRKQRDQLQFVLEAHKPSCRAADMVEVKPELAAAATLTSFQTMHMAGPSSAASAVRPSTLPIAQKIAPTSTACNTLVDLSVPLSFNYDLGTTGFTPVVSSSGMGVFLGTGSDFVSPTTLLLLSPSTLLAQ